MILNMYVLVPKLCIIRDFSKLLYVQVGQNFWLGIFLLREQGFIYFFFKGHLAHSFT